MLMVVVKMIAIFFFLNRYARPPQVFYGGDIKGESAMKDFDDVGSSVIHTFQVRSKLLQELKFSQLNNQLIFNRSTTMALGVHLTLKLISIGHIKLEMTKHLASGFCIWKKSRSLKGQEVANAQSPKASSIHST